MAAAAAALLCAAVPSPSTWAAARQAKTVAPASKPPRGGTPAPKPQPRVCASPKCRKVNKPGAVFCAFCGSRLPVPVTDADRLAAQARRLLSAAEWAEAERVARAALKKDARHTAARAALGCALVEQGDAELAKVELDAVLRVAPNAALAQVGYGVLYSRLGRPDAAARALKRAAALDPKDRYAANRLRSLAEGTLPGPPQTVAVVPPPQDGAATDPAQTDSSGPVSGGEPQTPASSAVEARNLLENGDMETKGRRGRIAGWELRDGASASDRAYSGERSARIGRVRGHVLQERKDAQPGLIVGQAYRLTLLARRDAAEAEAVARAEVVWTGENGGALATHATDAFAPRDSRWEPFAFPVPAPPPGARGFIVRVTVEATAGSRAALLLDDLSLAADITASAP